MERDVTQSNRSVSRSGSAQITSASRLGAALIMLGGGRRLGAMRTHGMSMPTVYDKFHRVIEAINTDPTLEIICDNRPPELQRHSAHFMERSSHELFKYCTGAIDGLAIHIRAPSNTEVMTQSRFFSGSKKKYCMNIVIVPGSGSRSYRVPTLPDPTGYYYCTLQLGCCIVEAICSVHVEVN